MRILVYGFSKNKGGKEEFMMNLNSQSIKHNIYFDYIVEGSTCYYSNFIKNYNGKIFFYKANNMLDKIKKIKRIIKSNASKYDFLYFNTSGLYFIFPILYGKKYGIKTIVHAHSAQEPFLKLYLKILNWFNRIIVNKIVTLKFSCSDLAKKWIFGNNKNVIQINNGIELKKYLFNIKTRNEYRKKLNFSPNDIVLINVGRMEFPKNQKFLIELMNYLDDNYKLLLVGDGKDFNELKKYSNNNILFLGNRDDVNNLLMASDLFLLPSFFEGFPISAVEAQASGMPCILSDRITKQISITELVKFANIDNCLKKKKKIESYIPVNRNKISNNKELLKFDVNEVSNQIINILLEWYK